MKNPIFSRNTGCAAVAFSFLLCSALSHAETGDESTGAASVTQLRQFSEKIDSLEVEKQVKKRNGLPLVELEEQTTAFRDSIKLLKRELERGSASVSPAASAEKVSAQGYLKKWLPWPTKSIFDRILLAAGCITILIGLFCLFILVAVRSRRKKQPPYRNETKRAAAQYEEVKRKVAAAQNAYPDSFAATESESAALASAVPPPDPVAPAAPPATQSRIPAQATGELRDLVLKASSEGLDPKEISRRFQISIDQVALIVKMGKR